MACNGNAALSGRGYSEKSGDSHRDHTVHVHGK